MTHKTTALLLTILIPTISAAQIPVRLTTDLNEHTERVSIEGYPSNITISDINSTVEHCQWTEVRNSRPKFAWQMKCNEAGAMQTAYSIIVATSPQLAADGKADVWQSGRIESRASAGVTYNGTSLQPATNYYWRVKTWDNHGHESQYSAVKAFRTAKSFDGGFTTIPLEKTSQYPVKQTDNLFDFGTDAFGYITLTLSTTRHNDTLSIHLGEQRSGSHVNRRPEGTQRYAMYRLPLMTGTHSYRIKIRKDGRNTALNANESGVAPIFMPSYAGEVMPFRYCEIEGYNGNIMSHQITRTIVNYPFDDTATSFECSDTIINRVWELCKHSIKATSFAGIYIDGDRERIPYEADAIINQLSHYATEGNLAMARLSINHLIDHPTWPTEWILQTPLMAWNDYMYSGDNRLIETRYEDLKAKTLIPLRSANGLISTRLGGQTEKLLQSIHFRGKSLRDIVDWPQSGADGIEKEHGGEADGFVFEDYNTVVNAFHYQALRIMERTASALGHDDDAELFGKLAAQTLKTVNTLMTDPKTGLYTDGTATRHCSLHANMFALAFGMVPEKRIESVVRFIKSRRMACSVYGAQFLLDGIYNAGKAAYGLSLLSSTGRRSWYNMLRSGSTITTEAWDNIYKANQDWNHAWGAAAANIIVRKLMGIEPAAPGYEKIRIRPQTADLKWSKLRLQTVKGPVYMATEKHDGNIYKTTIEIPANTTAELWLPADCRHITIDGHKAETRRNGKFLITNLSAGRHNVQTTMTQKHDRNNLF